MNNYSIDAAVIAKDEAANINELIINLCKFCNKIIIVDTGSSDNTATLATSLGADVYFHEWTNNFSQSRNHALRYASADWILAIDADERIDINSFNNCVELLSNPDIGGIRMNIINYTNVEHTIFTEHRYTRLFRRNPLIKYVGAIHEQVNESILEAGFQIADSDVNIFHYGYINPSEEKVQRNISMLENELRQSPESAWHKFHLASAEFANKNIFRAKDLFTQALDDTSLSEEQRETTFVRLAQIALKENEYQIIDRLSTHRIENTNLRGLLKSIQATSFLERRRFAEAYELYQCEEVLNSSMVDIKLIQSLLVALQGIL